MRRPSPGTAIRAILVLQLAMGAAMIAGDMAGGFRGLSLVPPAPRLDQPVHPGDQTRRYRPGALPDTPSRPFPATGDMPDRLTVEPLLLDGAAVWRLTGQIAIGDADRLADRLGGAPTTLLLHSPGGSVTDALALGRTIRAAGLTVRVAEGDVCLSACPYLLAGGLIRRADDGAFVGVHQSYFGENIVQPAFLAVEDIQRGQGEVMEYLGDMGVDPLLLRPALATPPDEIYILLPEELARYRLVTP